MEINKDKNITSSDEERKYLSLVTDEKLDAIQKGIYRLIVVKKKYLLPSYSAKHLSIDLKVSSRYVSATLRLRFHKSFTALIHEYRVKEACRQLSDPMLKILTVEEIGLRVGFLHRQTLYTAFGSIMKQTPKEYREKALHQTEK